ncbi:MAG TPA: SprT-like domain-containing protein [Thermodesulfovibrionales bacterium]|nr:SprT-like domain-containing protein [Thermodesulfovibrionales bacterium]
MNKRQVTRPAPGGQLRLPFGHEPSSLSRRLTHLSGKNIDLAITDNTSSMLSAAGRNGMIRVRMHRMFLHAGDEVVEAVAGFIAGRREVRAVIRDFIKKNAGTERKTVNSRALEPRGSVYCLSEIFARLNRAYFEDRITAGITWGRKPSRRRTRRITLGSYCSSSDTIRLNPLLDRRSVPLYFVEFIVYHEMLHADLKMYECTGRRRLHTKEFRIRERQFASFEKAIAWEKKQI